MQRVHILRRTFSSAPRVQSKAEDILSSYPIRLLGPTEDRRGYFEKYPGAPWHERAILMPLRLKMASAAGTGFLNNRFGTPPSSLPSASQNPEFFPTQFEEGVLQALPAVVKTLSGWNGDVDSQQGRRLAHYVTPGLLDRLSSVHKDIDAKGYALNLKWVEGDEDDLQVVPKHFWITFGEPSLATSTLLRGKVVSRYHIVAFTRK
ncbi:hypothetical protein BCR33DRAFT_169919 [Rhizoclosmatium globosum]|uniref:Uncharacterized protein n=1 Tax=Rhizoclosmatium globosum TaxID=329046 RepID=A0A1Y2CEP6_9FUNG|nr:hypothetical protein BCR33DRAFT_169919 [Rhizoclosmatium globosum]|eukprot:ORY45540.1 hypothetical protein BCR33DRAFT_169919 [Rhizoclosmatium globosum]